MGVVHRAYRLFEERAGQTKAARGAKRALVEEAVAGFAGKFALSELEQRCPGVSHDMVRRVLRDMQGKGLVAGLGRGPGAQWAKEGHAPKRGQQRGPCGRGGASRSRGSVQEAQGEAAIPRHPQKAGMRGLRWSAARNRGRFASAPRNAHGDGCMRLFPPGTVV